MASAIRHLTIDCGDVELVGRFWADALGYVEHPEYPNDAGDSAWSLVPPGGDGPWLLFVEVAEPKKTKNRVHFDLRPDSTREVEVERLVGLGACVMADYRNADGTGWVVMADPEGNEFCVERSAAEHSTAG